MTSELHPDTQKAINNKFINRIIHTVFVCGALLLLLVISVTLAAGITGVFNINSVNNLVLVTSVVFIITYLMVVYALTHDTIAVFEDATINKYNMKGDALYIDDTGDRQEVYEPIKYTNDIEKINQHDGVVVIKNHPVTVKSGEIYHTTYGHMDSLENIELSQAAVLLNHVQPEANQ